LAALGSCSCPGIVGITINGGVTNWLGVHGLLLDSLLSVRLVTAGGEVVEASTSSNPDLFWGIRGAGSNFGIITSATYQLHLPTNNNEIFIADMIFTADKTEQFYATVEELFQQRYPELSFYTAVMWEPTINQVCEPFLLLFRGTDSKDCYSWQLALPWTSGPGHGVPGTIPQS
jgi:FAD/FMN-containing dehydrogenase